MNHLVRPANLAPSPFAAIMQNRYSESSLSKSKYAKSIGISRDSLRRYLQDGLPSRPEVKKKVAVAFGITDAHLLGILRMSAHMLKEAEEARKVSIFRPRS
jgi:hypothetical protein